MDYDFSGLCADQIEKLEKRLVSLKKAFIKEYVIALNVINNNNANDHREEIKEKVSDMLNDTADKASIFYKECMNKIQRSMKEFIQ